MEGFSLSHRHKTQTNKRKTRRGCPKSEADRDKTEEQTEFITKEQYSKCDRKDNERPV